MEYNTTKSNKTNKRDNNNKNINYLDKASYNLSKIRCYNCNKNGNYINDYL